MVQEFDPSAAMLRTLSSVDTAHYRGRQYSSGIPRNARSAKGYRKYIKRASELVKHLDRQSKNPGIMTWAHDGNGVICTEGHKTNNFLKVKYGDQGAWISPWIVHRCGESANMIDHVDRIRNVITGSCLFGDHLYAVNSTGHKREVREFMEDGASTTKDIAVMIGTESQSLHADELKDEATFSALLPLLSNLASSGEVLRVNYNIPVPEYLLSGIQWYKEGKMTIQAFRQYAKLVVQRGTARKNRLQHCIKDEVQCDSCWSSLQCLSLEQLANMTNDELETFLQSVSITSLIQQLSRSHAAWAHYFMSQPEIEDFASLSLAAYVVFLAMHSPAAGEKITTAVVDDEKERVICHKYKTAFSDTDPSAYPALLGLHWFPAIVPSRYCWNRAAEQEAVLSHLVRSGMLSLAGSETRSITVASIGSGSSTPRHRGASCGLLETAETTEETSDVSAAALEPLTSLS